MARELGRCCGRDCWPWISLLQAQLGAEGQEGGGLLLCQGNTADHREGDVNKSPHYWGEQKRFSIARPSLLQTLKGGLGMLGVVSRDDILFWETAITELSDGIYGVA